MSSYFWSSTSSSDPTLGANWTKSDGSTGTAPGAGDAVYIAALPGVTLANIAPADMSGITLNSLTISQTFAGTIGSASYSSPLFGYWKIGAATWTIGAAGDDGVAYAGAGRIKIDFGASAFSGTVISTGASLDQGAEPVRILANNSASQLCVLGGRVGVATNMPGETATIGVASASGAGVVCTLGPGVTWTSARAADGAQINVNSAGAGDLSTSSGASATANGAGAIATVNAAGTVTLNNRPPSGAAVTTLNILPTGTADFSQNPAPVTVGTLNHSRGGVLSANPANAGHLTVTARNLIGAGTLTAS